MLTHYYINLNLVDVEVEFSAGGGLHALERQVSPTANRLAVKVYVGLTGCPASGALLVHRQDDVVSIAGDAGVANSSLERRLRGNPSWLAWTETLFWMLCLLGPPKTA